VLTGRYYGLPSRPFLIVGAAGAAAVTAGVAAAGVTAVTAGVAAAGVTAVTAGVAAAGVTAVAARAVAAAVGRIVRARIGVIRVGLVVVGLVGLVGLVSDVFGVVGVVGLFGLVGDVLDLVTRVGGILLDGGLLGRRLVGDLTLVGDRFELVLQTLDRVGDDIRLLLCGVLGDGGSLLGGLLGGPGGLLGGLVDRLLGRLLFLAEQRRQE